MPTESYKCLLFLFGLILPRAPDKTQNAPIKYNDPVKTGLCGVKGVMEKSKPEKNMTNSLKVITSYISETLPPVIASNPPHLSLFSPSPFTTDHFLSPKQSQTITSLFP